jgi:putative oxidoreductase
MKEYLPLFGRMGISLVFILLGLEKCMDFTNSTELLNALGFPAAAFLLVISIVIEFVGGFLVLIGYRVKIVAVIMAIYLLIVTSVFHPVWTDLIHFQDFVKNLAITGGLLTLAYYGGGPKSLDSNEL